MRVITKTKHSLSLSNVCSFSSNKLVFSFNAAMFYLQTALVLQYVKVIIHKHCNSNSIRRDRVK